MKSKDPKKQAAGRAGAAARKAKLLEKSPAPVQQHSWTPWLIFGAGLAAVAVTLQWQQRVPMENHRCVDQLEVPDPFHME